MTNTNQPFVALVASVVRFQARPNQFFAVFDSLDPVTTHSGDYISRSGRFRADNDRRTNRLLYSLRMLAEYQLGHQTSIKGQKITRV